MPADAPLVNIALELRNVSKYFGDLPALKDIRLRIEPSESVLLYGANGSGKTTLLRTLAALSRPSEGEVLFGDQDIRRNPAASRGRIGFVSHWTFLYGELTAYENLSFAATLFGVRDAREKIHAALDLFSVRDRAHQTVRTLSRGLQQRVTLARALLHDPDFLLLDEPFTGLDAEAVRNLQEILGRIPKRGKALLFSTHDFDQGAAVATRLVVIDRGRMRYDGPLASAPLEALSIAEKQ